MKSTKKQIPLDGIKGLKENGKSDILSGFLVFLLALPLSLGIAKASEFPPAMGVLTAMIGGIFVSFFAGSRLTIKGPAAGLITVCAGAVAEMGGGSTGWHLACAAIVFTGIIQFILSKFKIGSIGDFFPHSVVHGMLAAIGILIFAKQFPILLGVDPKFTKGLSPLELYSHIPDFISHANGIVATIGLFSLFLLFLIPNLGKLGKKIPVPLLIILLAVPIAMLNEFDKLPSFVLVKIGNFWGNISFSNTDFSMIGSFVFWKYVFMFLFVNTIESLLTVKAIDNQDPFKRKSDYNKDLAAVGLGNTLSGFLGGLPMISEVARSSANVGYGGKTSWSNFFHGIFLLLAMLLMIPVIEWIPNAALAAMLIFVAFRLASPKEFIGTYKIGIEQLIIFLITIIITIAEDLLLGVAAGILVKMIFHITKGVSIKNLFSAKMLLDENSDSLDIYIEKSAVFSNIISFKNKFNNLPEGKHIRIHYKNATFIDHSFQEFIHQFITEYEDTGGKVTILETEEFKRYSKHEMSAMKHLK
jgi:MFS superfamily sulfate permease-like transporter